ncbi:MAG: hypothetical protein ACMVY4_00065 [Minwuia sp.]|uniref:hypothetical protein n=1 Tax=Minwuia sp. TaxID=2493630 RepID=UPI003A8A087D
MPVLLSIVTVEDILSDVSRSNGEKHDPDVSSAVRNDKKAREAHKAARQARRMVRSLAHQE